MPTAYCLIWAPQCGPGFPRLRSWRLDVYAQARRTGRFSRASTPCTSASPAASTPWVGCGIRQGVVILRLLHTEGSPIIGRQDRPPLLPRIRVGRWSAGEIKDVIASESARIGREVGSRHPGPCRSGSAQPICRLQHACAADRSGRHAGRGGRLHRAHAFRPARRRDAREVLAHAAKAAAATCGYYGAVGYPAAIDLGDMTADILRQARGFQPENASI